MTLDRNDIAVRFAVALAAGDWACPNDMNSPPGEVVRLALEYTDALLLALTPPTVAPVAPTAYVPKVGDVVRIGAGDYPYECVLVDFTNRDEIRKAWVLKCGHGLSTPRFDSWSGYWPDPVYLRPATPLELAAAGLAVPPVEAAPEAKRPTRIRVLSDAYGLFTVGRVYDVIGWDDDVAGPRVLNDEGTRTVLVQSKWVPAPCPPPVAGSAEATRWRPSVEGCGKCQTSTWCCAARACLSESTPDGDRDVADRLALALAAKSGGA